jgi:hypothetical protein
MRLTDEEHCGVARALLRHPEWRGRLERAAASDEAMADLCGGYAAAWRGFEYWSRQTGAWAKERIAEYEGAIAGLEADIAHWLERVSVTG